MHKYKEQPNINSFEHLY